MVQWLGWLGGISMTSETQKMVITFKKKPPAGRAKGKGWGKSKAPKTAMTPGARRSSKTQIDSDRFRSRDELRQFMTVFWWGFQEDQTRRLFGLTNHVFFSPSFSDDGVESQPGKLGNCDKPNQGVTQTLKRGKKKETTTEMVKTPKHNSYIWL